MKEQLTEKGFVFIGDDSKPYWCRMQGGVPWVFYWHADNRWVSLKQVNQTYVWLAANTALTEEKAEMYHKLNEREC